jgi:pimeloyl-ACP methyl ester carboxylesterase
MASEPANFDSTFTYHTTTVNDVRLHYVMAGRGEPVVLLHGWPQIWYAWRWRAEENR